MNGILFFLYCKLLWICEVGMQVNYYNYYNQNHYNIVAKILIIIILAANISFWRITVLQGCDRKHSILYLALLHVSLVAHWHNFRTAMLTKYKIIAFPLPFSLGLAGFVMKILPRVYAVVWLSCQTKLYNIPMKSFSVCLIVHPELLLEALTQFRSYPNCLSVVYHEIS